MKPAFTLIALWLLLATPARADDTPLAPLLANGQLTVATYLRETATGLVPGQRGQLVIELATSNWFTGGARIRLPEVAGLVILQTETFATNASEQRGGQSWVVQRWHIDVYPQRPGRFDIGPIEVMVKVNGGELGDLSGPVLAPAVGFDVDLPAALAALPFWVAAPEFSVSQSLDRATDNLAPGEAFERRVTFRAQDVQAMMLPEFEPPATAGLASYPASPQLENRVNRGQANASRVQAITYVAQQPGQYQLPAQDFFWWNTEHGVLEVLSLAPVEVVVTGTIAAPAPSTGIRREQILGAGATALLVAVVLYVLLRYRPWRRLAGPANAVRHRLTALNQPGLPGALNPTSPRNREPR